MKVVKPQLCNTFQKILKLFWWSFFFFQDILVFVTVGGDRGPGQFLLAGTDEKIVNDLGPRLVFIHVIWHSVSDLSDLYFSIDYEINSKIAQYLFSAYCMFFPQWEILKTHYR